MAHMAQAQVIIILPDKLIHFTTCGLSVGKVGDIPGSDGDGKFIVVEPVGSKKTSHRGKALAWCPSPGGECTGHDTPVAGATEQLWIVLSKKSVGALRSFLDHIKEARKEVPLEGRIFYAWGDRSGVSAQLPAGFVQALAFDDTQRPGEFGVLISSHEPDTGQPIAEALIYDVQALRKLL
jgi:hypothetical protein